MEIKAGIVGIGYMGSAHARVYNEVKECNLVGVCDTNAGKRHLSERLRCQFFTDLDDFLRRDMDVVSICTPTATHKEIAFQALEQGKHVIIEKPLAQNVQDGEEIIKKAKKTGRLMAVGFLERFNPAIRKLEEVVDFSQIYSTISLRFGPGTPRIKDIGVLLDLGSHEIDTLNYLTKTRPEILYAYLSSNTNKSLEDYAYVSLKYSRIHAHIETSWLPNYKLRNLILYGNEKFYILDYAQQNIKSYRAPPRVRAESPNWQDMLWISRNVEEEVPVALEEPLKLELQHFIKSIKKGNVLDPICSGEDALGVLEIVEQVFFEQ